MQKLSIGQLLEITQGSLLKKGKRARAIHAVSTDTRQIGPGALFIAIKGPRFDGHDFIAQAIESGAAAVCASDAAKVPDGDFTVILVEDTLFAYQSIAAFMREEQGYAVVGVTGSVGKTSTRAMIASALSLGMTVHQTKANFNNEIGLPRTLLETPDDAGVCIVEMGMRGPGEIRRLTQIARPDIAVITKIGYSHIELLGSQEAILDAKTEIVEGLRENGLLIYNANDPLMLDYGNRIASDLRTAAVMVEEEIPVRAEFTVRGFNLEQAATHVKFQVEIKSFQAMPLLIKDVVIPVPGAHNVAGALIGIAVAVELGLNLQDAVRGLSTYRAVGNRQRILEHGGLIIIDDTYNAGPESMRAAIEMLSDIAGARRKIAVLGGMLELGAFSPLAHEGIGKVLADQHIDRIYVCGPEAGSIGKGFGEALGVQGGTRADSGTQDNSGIQTDTRMPQIRLFENRDELAGALQEEVRSGDVVLVKGSRGFEMEKVTQALLLRTDL